MIEQRPPDATCNAVSNEARNVGARRDAVDPRCREWLLLLYADFALFAGQEDGDAPRAILPTYRNGDAVRPN